MTLGQWLKKLFARPKAGPAPTPANPPSPSSHPSTSPPSQKSSPPPTNASTAKPPHAASTAGQRPAELAERPWALDARSARNLAGCDEHLQELARELLRRLHDEGWVFKVTSGNRTQSEQDRLYAQGRTAGGPIVTWTRHSRHIGGRAFDITLFTHDGTPCWESPAYRRAGEIGQRLGLVWGGRWQTPDEPHFELPA